MKFHQLFTLFIVLIFLVFPPTFVTQQNNIASSNYIQDANKLVSVAEYKINSNSLKIEKPDPDNCIILSYDYLNDGSIKNPPGKGTYLGSTSYVVVKNDGGKLDYSVALIEEAKEFHNDHNLDGVCDDCASEVDATYHEETNAN